jgi:hypothetical protein
MKILRPRRRVVLKMRVVRTRTRDARPTFRAICFRSRLCSVVPAMTTAGTREIERFFVEVPRYTSYPTAADFTASVGADVFAANLRSTGSSAGRPLSLYIHLPFCREICTFCGCHAMVARTEARIDRYLEALVKEMDLVTVEETRIRLTPLGRVFVRNVAAIFDAHRRPAAAGTAPRFSMSA